MPAMSPTPIVSSSPADQTTPQETTIRFVNPMPGLEGYEHFILSRIDDSPVYWLQCADEPTIAMPVAEVFVIEPSYSFDLSDHDQQLLGLEEPRDALVFAVLTVTQPQGTITANLMAPVVYNLRGGSAKQIILDDGRYALRHPVKAL